MRGFVDRIVDGVAVVLLDGGGRAYVPVSGLPEGLQAGHLVDITVARVDLSSDAAAADEVAELIERLRAGGHRHG